MTTSAASSNLQVTALTDQGKVKIVAGYALQQRLGAGSFATVYKGVKVSEKDSVIAEGAENVAIKAIARSSEKLTRKVLENLELEISILRTYRHPNIVCLHDVQKTDHHYYLILEYCGGGDLQRLIRTRKNGRLSESLTRRLMRDLSSGLNFLWGQELIHRDIKPQNLLLTGPLPMDEMNDPAKMDAHEEFRQQANFPSSQFALKIADFGFARHLQTTSLAETLCGSPLYMAPEILQHQRYDAKADLWSVGTVLFEMISGRPPFNGDNHIDLLRNIQRKAVRLPPDVRVSKECVTLLRLLLNRNPLSRAGFKEFLPACAAFVALGCEGVKTEEPGTCQPTMKMDLGTIHEVDPDTTHGAASMMTTATATQFAPRPARQRAATAPIPIPTGIVTPPFGPLTTPSAPFSSPPFEQTITTSRAQSIRGFVPLEPSPPASNIFQSGTTRVPTLLLDNRSTGQSKQKQLGAVSIPSAQNMFKMETTQSGRNESSQNSSDDSEFVMVEHGGTHRNDTSPSASGTVLVSSATDSLYQVNRGNDVRPKSTMSPPSSPRYFRHSIFPTRGEYLIVNDSMSRHVPKGILSTSPGTGGALVGMMSGPVRARLMNQGSSVDSSSFDSQMESATKMIATAEDVGRRAISVAHLGDTRAYLAMRLVASNDEGPLLLSAGPMEGVEEESDEQSSANVTDCEDCSASTEIAAARRRRSVSTDRSMPDVTEIEDDHDDMPFAMSPESPAETSTMATLPARNYSSLIHRRSRLSESKRIMKPHPETIRIHFAEALSCYLKALAMLKSVLNAVQRVQKDLDLTTAPPSLSMENRGRTNTLLKRCDVTAKWLSGQFTGILERADAANVEIAKLLSTLNLVDRSGALPVTSVEELIYNHSLACGRDGAVKQLLGQYDAARSCYRSAGLLAETLLMEPSVGSEDRDILEGYVDRFAARITELDTLMLQQSRVTTSSLGNSVGTSKRGSGVIGLIGGIPPPSVRFDPATPFTLETNG